MKTLKTYRLDENNSVTLSYGNKEYKVEYSQEGRYRSSETYYFPEKHYAIAKMEYIINRFHNTRQDF